MEDNKNLQQDHDSHSKVSSFPKWYSRLAAYIVDSFIVMLICIPLALILGLFASVLPFMLVGVIYSVVFSLAIAAYFAYLHSTSGQTLGMKFIGTKITQSNGDLLSFQNAFLRSILFYLPVSLLSFVPLLGMFLPTIYLIAILVFILVDKKNQGFHDKIVNAVNLSQQENTGKAKTVIGCSCGCGLVALVGMVILAFTAATAFSSLFGGSLSKFMTSPYLNKGKTEMPAVPAVKMPKNVSSEEGIENQNKQIPSMMDGNSEISSVFYNSCMQANTNPQIDLSEYCACAAEEFSNTQDTQEIVNRCKDKIILK